MSFLERIGVPKDKNKIRPYCEGFLAALMEARGYIIQVRTKDFKHEALDELDAMIRMLMETVIEHNADMRKSADDPMAYNPEPGWRS